MKPLPTIFFASLIVFALGAVVLPPAPSLAQAPPPPPSTSPTSPEQETLQNYKNTRYGLDRVAGWLGIAGCDLDDATGDPKPNTCQRTDPRLAILSIVQYALGFTSLITLGVVIYGAMMWVTSAGNQERVTKGKDTLMWAAIGLVVLFAAWGIVTYIMYLTTDILARGVGG